MTSPRLSCRPRTSDGVNGVAHLSPSPPSLREKELGDSNGHKPLEVRQDHLPRSILSPSLDASRQGLVGIDWQGRCTFLNQAAAEMLGLSPEEATGRRIPSCLLGADGTSYSLDQLPKAAAFLDVKACGVERGTLCRRDGHSFPAEFSIFPVIQDGLIQGVVLAFVNTLERERLEQHCRQAQKMEALGRLAGGIAHDFNNLLTAILGYSELMRAGISNSEPLYHDIVEINKAAQRAASLTSQLLNFSRKQDIVPQCLDLNVLLADMERMIHRLLGKDVELSLALHPALACVKADQGQMEQVVLNLAVNARDAMPRGGKLSIATANVEGDTLGGKVGTGFQGGRYVMLEFKDTGCGMDESTRLRIFEPFFTTKGPGQGTGMGLATVLSIVRENQGFIEVASRPGEGTSFQIYLPRIADRPEPAPATPLVHASGSPTGLAQQSRDLLPQSRVRKGAVQRGGETVLLVEDEDTLRHLVQSILARYGYHVLKAASAAEALQIGQHHPEPIHLMLTDLILPQMNGLQLAERMARWRPQMGVLYMSGSADDTVARHCLSQKDLAMIRKPFTPIDLAGRVRDMLDEGKVGRI